MNIKILPSHIVNQIAAGEVIERPSSIIKELVENAVDAGSTSINIFVRDGGISYICIKDNGCGMSKEDLELSIQRHATSKLTGKNLLDIHTFGFRGEALPSICSISKLNIKTKQKEDISGWSLKVDAGDVVDVSPTNCDQGTIISLTDMFYTTPARLKFLKSVQTELGHCVNTVKQLAMSNHNVSFAMINGSKNLFSYDSTDDFETRIKDIFGNDFFKNGSAFKESSGNLEIYGWLGLPTYRNNNTAYCFVNGRPVKDRFLNAAIRVAYQNVIIPGEQPPFVIFLKMDPQEVDMNVHPAKSEVRFREQSKIRSFVINAIQKVLSKSSMKTSDNNVSNVFYNEVTKNNVLLYDKKEDFSFQNFTNNQKENNFYFRNNFTKGSVAIDKYEREFENPRIEENNVVNLNVEEKIDLGFVKTQIFSSYIISQNENTMFIIDQHAVHERIVYEQIKKDIFIDENGWIVSKMPIQKLLFPEEINISEFEDNSIDEYLPYISKMGFCIEKNKNYIKILEVPKIFCENGAALLLKKIIKEMIDFGVSISFLNKIHKIFADHACHNSIRANHDLSEEEMNEMLRQIENTERIGQCNHGRPSYVKISKKKIEQLFERV